MNYQQNYLNRRNFLRFTTGIGLMIGLDQLIPQSVKANLKQSQSELQYPDIINLNIQETNLTIAGNNAQVLTINNTLPGQIVRLKEGQTAIINVTNNLNRDTSIHWHGIILPTNMDGVPGISFAGIKSGETFTYRFEVKQSGTYWYHSHSGLQEQQGHYGALIIDPLEPEPYNYHQDYVVLLSDWTFENPDQVLANLKKMPTFYNWQRRTIGSLSEDWEWQGMRMDPTDIADVTGATYTYLMNGLAPDDNWTALFNQGEKVRLRLINASAMTFFDVRIPGLKMTVIQADGQNIQPVTVDELRLGTAETYDIIVEPTESAYTIFAETMDRSGYARGILAVSEGLNAPIPERRERPLRTMADMGHDHSNINDNMSEMDHSNMNHNVINNSPRMHGNDNHGLGNASIPMMVRNRLNEPGIGLENTDHKVLVYTDLKSLKPYSTQSKIDREIELHLTGNMERYMWSFDGKKYSQDPEIIFYYGEKLRLTLVNDTMMEHPIHLHGMWMELDNGHGLYKPRKHTIIVKPAEILSTEINVDAPGKWAFHCHLLYHMETGMFRTVTVINYH